MMVEAQHITAVLFVQFRALINNLAKLQNAFAEITM